MERIGQVVRHAMRGAFGAALVGATLLGAACDAPSATPDVVVLTEQGDPATAVDPEQEQLIRRLLQTAREQRDLAAVTVDYPLDETIFPPEIIAPTILWHDAAADADRWLVDLAYGEGPDHVYILAEGVPPPQGEIDPMALSDTNEIYQPTPYQASAMSWKPSARVWEAVKQHSTGRPARLTFYGYRDDAPDEVLSRGGVTLTTSTDPVGAPVFYRDVPLMPPPEKENTIMPLRKGALPLIQWRLRDISRPDSRLMLSDMPTCANCHSFSADGDTMGMDIDGPRGDKGAYAIAAITRDMVIAQEDVISWNSFEDKTKKTLGFMSRMSPDGRHSVTTLNELIYVANYKDYKFGQVFYPTQGILAYYSAETGEIKALPGANDDTYVHADPVWTPDGKTIVFARAEAMDPFPPGRPASTYAGDPNEIQIQYDLHRMPFDEGRGGRPEPIAGASANGMSNSFPKVSPDGKWIVFVKCQTGQLMRPDSELWIVPAAGGEARRLRANMSPMNSWHSWSPNGRWLVFSSKANTPYTQMFLTHIDEQGNDSPAVLIENATAANRAVNLPEFINRSYDEFAGIYVEAVEHYREYDRGQEFARAGRIHEAAAAFEEALEKSSGESRIHVSLSKALLNLGQYDRAMEQTKKALEINPYNYEMHMNYGFLLARQGDVETGLKHLDAAIRINPLHPLLWYNRATLHVQREDYDKALGDYTEALELQPRYPDALNGRGIVRRIKGDLNGALADFDDSIRINPRGHEPRYFRALILKDTGDLPGAMEELNAALEFAPPASTHRAKIESLRREVSAALGQGG
jgi:tetratricopeptide (TPR) repeat protein